MSERQAIFLQQNLKPGQPVMDQLEYADYRIASEPAGTFRNPPGFYISVIRDNTPVPENFETSRKRRELEEIEQRRSQERNREVELENAYGRLQALNN